MKKQLHFLLFAGLFFCFSLVKAQVGIGTPMPDLSAQLDVVAQDKGILIPRIALSDIHDMETITGGNIESLLVFNTTSTNAIKPGYYYWFDNSWHRVVTAQDVSQGGVVENMVVYDPLNDVFNYINNAGDNVTIDLESLVRGKETITRLTENPDGTYSYYNEASIDEAGEPIIGSGLVIDIPGSVVNEFKEIITNNTVKEQLFEAINNSYVGGNVYFDGSKFTYVTKEGDNKEVTIQEIIEANETKTTIFDEGNGTYTYTNESGDEVVIDANTTTVTLTDGVYTFTDASGAVITSIDTNALASGYNNTTSGLTADNVQNAIDEVVTAINSGGGVELIDNGDGTVSLVSEDGTTLGSVNKTSVVDLGDGTYTIDNGDGTPVTINTNADALAFDNTTNGFTSTNVQDAIDELATDLANTTDILLDNGNGTFTHTAVDGKEVIIDANTTTVTSADGVYTFTDASGATITTIDTNATASGYENTTSGLTADNVQDAIDEVVAALNSGGGVELIDNGDGTVSLVSEDGTTLGSVNKTSVVDLGDGTYTIDNGDGTPVTINTNADALAFDNTTNGFTSTNVQDAIDELATDLANTTDILVDNGNGTFTHTAVDGKEVIIDANTTTVELLDGVYTFKDGSGATITTIDTNATASGYENATSGLTADNVQDAIDEVSQIIKTNKGTLGVAGGLEFTGGTDGTAKLLADAGIQVADGGISTDKLAVDAVSNDKLADNAVQSENIADGAVGTIDLDDESVTAEKLVANSGSEGMVGVVQADGSVVYQNISATNVDGNNFTSNDLTITNGVGATLTTVTAEITDGAVDTAALADDAVTNVKLADNAVESENIVDGAVGTDDLGETSVTAGKMNSTGVPSGQLLIADGTGGASYGNVSATNVDGNDFTSNDLTITNGVGATLTTVTAEITNGAVDTAALADDAVTNVKLADNAVQSENIADGAVGTIDLDDESVTAGKMNSTGVPSGQLLIADGTGGASYGNVSATNVDGNDFTSNDLTITNGVGATLTTVTAEITDGAVDNNALGGDAVTNDKLADNAVQTENIVDGAVGTIDLEDESVTAEKLVANSGSEGMVGVVQADGSVVYQNISATNVDGNNFTSNDLTITNGVGATLTAVTAEITDGAVDTAALADDAVTNVKLADNAVQTENIVDGGVQASDINSNVAGNGLIQNATDGSLEVDPSAVAVIADGNITSDDLLVTGGDNAAFTDVTLEINADAINATKINDDVAGEGLSRDTNTSALNVNAVNGLNVVNDNVQLGGVLLEPTTITTDIDNTLAIQGLQTGSQTDNIVVADPVSGALKQVNAAMPKFFYMPSIIFDTSVSGSFSRNLHQEYLNQFTGAGNPGLVRSTGAPADIPNLPTATELYYYITYYDTAVFSNVTVDENGLLSYDVIGNATPASFMNIVFVVK